MKINEKNLSLYATSNGCDKEGYLIKRGDVNKGYQKRWFVLKGNLLFYFEKKGDKEPLGVIILEGCTIELDESETQYSFKIVFHGVGNRNYVLCADSQQNMEDWMRLLACASYDYMKLVVIDLQRQLDETKGSIAKTSFSGTQSKIDDDVSFTQDESFMCVDSGIIDLMGSSKDGEKLPPRSRVNPFNKQLNVNQRSTSRISFRELHTLYGRPILRHRNEWRHTKKLQANEQTLISF